MTYKSKITTAIATGAVLLNALAPLTFADSTISGNGAGSQNKVDITNNQTTTVNQSNTFTVNNNINSSASTGGNKADDNTAGNTTVTSGNATVNDSVTNTGNLNKATVSNTNADPGNVNITNNGAGSKNTVNSSDNGSSTSVSQNNVADFSNNVTANATTGKNSASDNTGRQSNVQSGNAETDVNVTNAANANVATVGDPNSGSNWGDPSSDTNGGAGITIDGNGAHSKNKVEVTNDNSVVLDQGNEAEIGNSVDANAKTGDNKANDNTAGDTSVQSGNATTNVGVSNEVNFNSADVSDGSYVWANPNENITGGNGAHSKNDIKLKNNNGLWVNQDSPAALFNDVAGGSSTGKNKGSDGTAGESGIYSGDSNSSNSVNNAGNVNLFNSGGTSYDAGFDLGSLLGWFTTI